MRKNPCGIGIFAACSKRRTSFSRVVAARDRAAFDPSRVFQIGTTRFGDAHACLKRIRCFFRCAVVIEVQCSRFATALILGSPSWNGLGGQHGEESQIKDEVGSEEDGEEDEAPEVEAEVVYRHFATTFDFEECRGLSHTSRRGRGEIATRVPEATPAQVANGGRRGDRGSSFTDRLLTGTDPAKTEGRTGSVPPMAEKPWPEPRDLTDALGLSARPPSADRPSAKPP
jgi:hypothetical protein